MSIAILGYGTVAKGTVAALEESGAEVSKVLVRRELPELSERASFDFVEIEEDESISLVAELIGGDEPAFSYVRAALLAGKDVVSANKLMISRHYSELLEIVRESDRTLAFSAAAGGGIPWLPNLIRLSRSGKIRSVYGIMNGTTNYILDRMTREGLDFPELLAEAQRLGFAEADPSSDIDGLDVIAKLALSCNIAAGGMLNPDSVPALGIRYITKADIDRFKSLGLVCKLIGRGDIGEDGILSAYVQPMLFKDSAAEAGIMGAGNIISAELEGAGKLSFLGAGAGGAPTGAAVAADIRELIAGRSIFSELSCSGRLENDCSCAVYDYYLRRGNSEPERLRLSVLEVNRIVSDEIAAGKPVFAAAFAE